jgi:hypothetical protein
LNREERKAYDAARYQANPKKYIDASTRWRKLNPERFKLHADKWRANNADMVRELFRKWAAENPELKKKIDKAWALKNRHKINEKKRRREATKCQASPNWRNSFFIEEIYDLARLRTEMLGIQHHVDHIVPLHSNTVCGLHVEFNLRVITARENIIKSNAVWENMP